MNKELVAIRAFYLERKKMIPLFERRVINDILFFAYSAASNRQWGDCQGHIDAIDNRLEELGYNFPY